MLRRTLKILHEIGSFGMVGTLATCIVLIHFAPTQSPIAYAALRQEVLALTKWLLVPSLVLVLISGLLAIAANRAYMDAGWAWVKALLGVSMFEGTLLTVVGSARHAAELSSLAVTGHGDPVQLAQVLRTEWGGLWIILTVSLANIVLGVWRPKFRRRIPA
jgi:hypothetical protein